MYMLIKSRGYVVLSCQLVYIPFTLYIGLGVPEPGTGWDSIGFGIVVEDKPSELSCITRRFVVFYTYDDGMVSSSRGS